MVLTLCIVVLLASIPLSAAGNAYYTVCSNAPKNCGNVGNLGYPFWGENRPKFCGHPEFLINCATNSSVAPSIHIPTSDETAGYFKPTVVHINTSTRTMILVDQLFSTSNNSCQSLIINETLPNLLAPFKYSRLVGNITLFFDCNTSVASNHRLHSFTCNNDINGNSSISTSTTDSAYYFDKPSEIDSIGKSCPTRSTFPVLLSELGELSKANASLLSVLQNGFEVEYTMNFSSCLACQNSGGICGSSDDASAKFICYCRHGAHPLACPKLERRLWIYLGSGFGGGILVFLALAFCYRKHLHIGMLENDSFGRSPSEIGKDGVHLGVAHFSYKELEEATNNFDQNGELGGGGFGTVYYGKLRDGREVAVKRLYERSFKRVEQFMNEVQLLTFLRHQNLVSLYGCTSCHSRELLLVYEYVSNGTVADHLYGDKAKPGSLPWPVRLTIAIETATALSYLHASDIIHRDVKPNNILLDKNFNVKVADFGLSRLFPTDVTHVSTAPQGTPGYLDPEYHQCYRLTDKSDVYSFGVVLIELISSLRAVDMDRHNYEINLSNYAMNKIQKSAFDELVDPQLGFASDFKVRRMTISVAELAFQCLQHYRDFRPSMDEVLEVLKRIESFDYEALQIEEMAKHNVVNDSNLPPPHTEENDVALLSKHQLSPTSVMEIVSSSSTSESTSSQGGKSFRFFRDPYHNNAHLEAFDIQGGPNMTA